MAPVTVATLVDGLPIPLYGRGGLALAAWPAADAFAVFALLPAAFVLIRILWRFQRRRAAGGSR